MNAALIVNVLKTNKQTKQNTKKLVSFFNLVQFSRSVVSDPLRLQGLEHARLSCPSPTPELAQTHVNGFSDAIQPSHPLSSPSPAFNLSQNQGLFQWVSSFIRWPKYGVSDSASVLTLNIQDWFPLELTCCPRGSQGSSPTLWFKSISSSVLSGDSPDKNTWVGCCALLQGIFPTQGLNPGLLDAGGFFTVGATREAWSVYKIFF